MFSKLFGSCFQKRNGRNPAKQAKSATPSEDATGTETEGSQSHSRSQSYSRYPRIMTDNDEPGSFQLEDLKFIKPVITTTRNEELGPLRKGPKGISNSEVLGNAPELEFVLASDCLAYCFEDYQVEKRKTNFIFRIQVYERSGKEARPR